MCPFEATEHYTYDDYVQWQGDWELIYGMPVAMTPSPGIRHQAIAAKILNELMNSVGSCEHCLVLMEQDWKLRHDTVVRPDVVLTCNEPNEQYLTKAPEIIVEVISPSTARRDEQFKFELYENEGVRYYILVYPDDRRAKVFKLIEGKFIKQGDYFSETYEFIDVPCSVKIDFGRVF